MSLRVVASLVSIAAFTACPDCGASLSPLGSDGGGVVDAGLSDGQPTDSGPHDAGSNDVGDDAGEAPHDAGTIDPDETSDAGPYQSCFAEAAGVPFRCEGDEDFCDAFGDAPVPQADILAAWSRIENGALVLELRFAAPPFTAGGSQYVVVMLHEDDDASTDDLQFEPSIEDCSSSVVVVDRWFILGNFGSASLPDDVYPPNVFYTDAAGAEGGSDVVDLSVCEDVQVSTDGRTLRLTLRGDFAFTEGRRFLVESNHPYLVGPARSCDMSPAAFDPVTSQGGRADDVEFVAMCEAACPPPG